MKIFFLFSVFLALLSSRVAFAADPQVDTPLGTLRGKAINQQVNAFLGVRYGADTSGPQRWQPPQLVQAWQSIVDATEFGADCLQLPPPPMQSPWGPEFMTHGEMSEDCLFLNIWAPNKQNNAPLPVLVWIHGGAFIGGSGSIDIYNGAALAEQGVIVVTINYRLGILGFMGHPALQQENSISGQYGLLDQLAAIKWVSQNISAFGGDPNKITIAGQSAGAASVHALLSHQTAGKLFHQAIAQSGTGMGISYPTQVQAQQLGAKVQAVLGAKSLVEMRALPGDQVLQVVLNPALGVPMAFMQFRPVLEGAFDEHKTHPSLPLLTGFTGNENSYLIPQWQVNSPSALAKLFTDNLGQSNASNNLLALYTEQHSSVQEAGLGMLRERALMSAAEWVNQHRQADSVFMYQFDVAPPGPPQGFGSFHSGEIPYVFGNLEPGDRQYTAEDSALSAKLSAHWVQFVKQGNPSVNEQAWPAMNTSKMLRVDPQGHLSVTPLLSDAKRALYLQAVSDGAHLGMFNGADRH